MLGITGARYAANSGAAFSFVLTVALMGNMLVNYLMGIIANRYGIGYLIYAALVETAVMILLSLFIFKRLKQGLP